MDKHTESFLNDGEAGRPVYIGKARRLYGELASSASFELDIRVALIQGGSGTFRIRLPKFLAYPERARAFAGDFFIASMYNIISALGGRAIAIDGHGNAAETETLANLFVSRFGAALPRHARKGHGMCLNVAERVQQALFPDCSAGRTGFPFFVGALPESLILPPRNEPDTKAADVFARAVRNLENKTILGVDIGGTDIKLALAIDGRLIRLKEFDWHPSLFTRMEQLIEPILDLVRLMGLAAIAESGGAHANGVGAAIAPALREGADAAAIREAVEKAKRKTGAGDFLFDAIGVCFPDVVVNNKIVGGETPKTRGIREALGQAYDQAFVRLTNLDGELSRLAKPGGAVAITNDGPMAAFAAGVETAVSRPEAVRNGVLAHTLGTDLGTGWIDEHGAVPAMPLEVYNFIIDLGSFPERVYEPDDVRSVKNFNTGIAGTLQKYASQSGVFRLALKYFPGSRPDLAVGLFRNGFVETRGDGLFIPTEPKDMRKPFLEHVMGLAEKGEPEAMRIFREVGEALAVATEEIDWVASPAVRERMLFGRLVKKPACFALMQQGAAAAGSDAVFSVADENMAETALMRQLARTHEFTVAQFAQAVAAVYFGNL